MDEPRLPDGIDNRGFTVVKRGGFDQREVMVYLEDLEQAFRDLELWAQRTKDRLVTAELEVERARRAEDAAVENAMSAVFDAKDRILQRAHDEANRIEARALSGGSGSGGLAVQDEAERLRSQAERLLADAERRAEAMMEAAERRLTEARERSAAADKLMAEAKEASAAVDGEQSTWSSAAQTEMMSDLRRRLEIAEERVRELEEAKAPDQRLLDRANAEAESIIAAAQARSRDLLAQAQAAVTMPGGEAVAAAEERAASIIAEAESRARRLEEAALGIRSQSETEIQAARDQAARFQSEAQQAKADAQAAEGRLAEAQASYRNVRTEVDDLRDQLTHARAEIDRVRAEVSTPAAPDYPPAPPVTAADAADGIVSAPVAALTDVVESPTPSLEEIASRHPSEDVEDRGDERSPVAAGTFTADTRSPVTERGESIQHPNVAVGRRDDDDFLDGDEPSASERLRIAAQRLREESGLGPDAAVTGGSRYEKRSAGLPRIGAGSDFGGLRSRLSGDKAGHDDEDDA